MKCLPTIIFLNLDLIQIEPIKLVFEFKNMKLPMELLNLYSLNSNVHSQ